MGVYRGYFQGMQDMVPTAVSQVLENLGRVVVGLLLATLFLPDLGLAAGGASFGAVAGGVSGALALAFLYQKRKPALYKEIEQEVSQSKEEIGFLEVAKKVLWIAIPISIGAAVNSVMNFLDSALVARRLIETGYSSLEATAIFGQLTKVATFINFPLTFGMALVIGLVPAISEAIAKKNNEEVQNKIQLGTRFALLIALPASVGLSVLASPIMKLMYPEASDGASILAVAAFTIAFTMLGQAFTGILQGMGAVFEPVKGLLLAGFIKAILNYVLIGTGLGIVGAPVASIIGYAVFAFYNYKMIQKKARFKLDLNLVFVKPILASLLMGSGAFITYTFLEKVFTKPSLVHQGIITLGAIGVGGILYIFFIFVLGGITKEDLKEMRNKK
jgi:stage V sporulation protein B